jgi:PAS domain S-box-containing protein
VNVRETVEYLSDRVQIAIVIGSVPTDGSGDIEVLHANGPAAVLFGYSSPERMVGLDVRSLMPPEIARDHRGHVGGYVERANGGKVRQSSIMGSWRKLHGVRADGSRVSIEANVCDLRNNEERYFVAFFKDRTEIEAEIARAEAATAEAHEATREAERLARVAEEARKAAEDGLLRQRRLSGQITLLRQIFAGTTGLVVMLGVLVVAQWSTGSEGEGLSMIKDVLLVLTGILGSAMASVFDTRSRDAE